MTAPRWLNYLVFAGLLVALSLNWFWPWGVLFLYWTVVTVRSGEVHLVGTIDRHEMPVLFWLVTVLWLLLGILMILIDAAPSVVDGLYARLWGLA